jgi:ankyrin repeat protein
MDIDDKKTNSVSSLVRAEHTLNSLADKSYRELQVLAKAAGIKANQKKSVLVELLVLGGAPEEGESMELDLPPPPPVVNSAKGTAFFTFTGDQSADAARVLEILQGVADQTGCYDSWDVQDEARLALFIHARKELVYPALMQGSVAVLRLLFQHGAGDAESSTIDGIWEWLVGCQGSIATNLEEMVQCVLDEVELNHPQLSTWAVAMACNKLYDKYDAMACSKLSDADDAAATRRQLRVMKMLLDSPAFRVDAIDQAYCMSDALSHPTVSAELIALLLDAKCDVNVVNADEEWHEEWSTPICKAAGGKYMGMYSATNLECVKLLLDRRADVHIRDFRGCDALLRAVYAGVYAAREIREIDKKLQAPATLDDRESLISRRKKLEQGVVDGEAIVRLLLEHKANPALVNHETDDWEHINDNALIRAASAGLTGYVRAILESGRADPDVRGGSMTTPLHAACEWGESASVGLLLSYKANANAVDDFEMYPLHYACSISTYGCSDAPENAECTRLLLEADADPRVEDRQRMSVLQHAAQLPTTDCMRLLVGAGLTLADANLDRGDGGGRGLVRGEGSAIHAAAAFGGVDNLRYLLELGANVHVKRRGAHEVTPLHTAAWRNKADNIRFLVHANADVNVRDIIGRTPLFAISRSRVYSHEKQGEAPGLATFQLLVELKADLNATDTRHTGVTAMFSAIRRGRVELLKAMVAAGMDVNAAATRVNNVLEERGDIRAEMAPGTTPLMEALSASEPLEVEDMLAVLLEARADVNALCEMKYNAVAHVTEFMGATLGASKPRVVFELLCFGMEPGFPHVPDDDDDSDYEGPDEELELLSLQCQHAMLQGYLDYIHIHTKVDAFHSRLLVVLEDEVVVDTRSGVMGRGGKGIYQEPLWTVLEYLGLAHAPVVLNEALDGEGHPGRVIQQYSMGAAKFWHDRFGPPQCAQCHTTTANKLTECECLSGAVYCSTECEEAHQQAHKKVHDDCMFKIRMDGFDAEWDTRSEDKGVLDALIIELMQ